MWETLPKQKANLILVRPLVLLFIDGTGLANESHI